MSETKTIAAESGHWYDGEGNPAYEQPNKSKPGEMRPTTLRDAKKLGLYPSVTTICKMIASPGLQNWIVEQAYMSAYTCPLKRSEVSGEDWIARVRTDAQEHGKKAREKGTEIHAEIEKGLSGQHVKPEHEIRYLKVLDALKQYDITMIEAEKSFTRKLTVVEGYGGKIDIRGKGLIADIKTTEFKLDADGKPSKKLQWPEHILQLSAYAMGVESCIPVLINIYVSTVSDDVYCHEWTQAEYENNKQQFELLVKLWYMKNWK